MQGIGDQRRPAVSQAFDEVVVEALGVLVEQCLDEGRRHRRQAPSLEPGQVQICPQTPGRIKLPNPPQRGDRRFSILAMSAGQAERKPGGRPLRHTFDRLNEEVDCGAMVAFSRERLADLVAAVRQEIAGCRG